MFQRLKKNIRNLFDPKALQNTTNNGSSVSIGTTTASAILTVS